MTDPYQPCPYRPLNEYGGPLGLPPLLQIGDVRLLLPPLVVRRDDDLRVAEPRHLLARGEAAVRLLDERGQVVHARPPELLQNLNLKDGSWLQTFLHFFRQYCYSLLESINIMCRLVRSLRLNSRLFSVGSFQYSKHVKPFSVQPNFQGHWGK